MVKFYSAILLLVYFSLQLRAQDQVIYSDSLQNNWESYGWATLNYANTSPTQAGSDSIKVTAAAWQAMYLHHAAQDSSPYASLSFWINGGTGGQKLQVQATLSGNAQTPVPIGPLTANTWQQVTVSLTALGVANNPNFDGFWIQDTTGTTQAAFYVDTISLIAGQATSTPPTTNPAVKLVVNTASHVHAISPQIYGVAFATEAQLADLKVPLNRMGGNSTTRYNWQVNADNRANDYYYESIGDTSATPGERGDTFIQDNKTAGADTMLTIPTIPWIAKLGANRAKLASFSVQKYGAQQSTDYWMPDAGNGVHTNGTNITGNDPNDANTPNSTTIEAAWMKHIVTKWGKASKGGLKYYIMDNEPSIWFSTHRDVAPVGRTMAQVKSDILTYSALVKAADSTALVVGPEEWGWEGYFYSGYDQQYAGLHGYSYYPDKAANGNADYLPWLLQQIKANDAATKKRSLDVFSVHYYPQGGEFGDDVSTAMQLRRNESTRELWDPAYTSKTWINDKVQLIPRIKGWVTSYYPGTKTAITEYNWGAESNINGATTQADIWGIFGREGLDLATRWTTPATGTPTYNAMKMYRNYDNNSSGFGDTSVLDTTANPDALSSFAAVRSSDGTLTVIVINKVLTGQTPIKLYLHSFTAKGPVEVWQLTSANVIKNLPSTTVASGLIKATLPAQSITLYIIPKA